MDTRDPIFSILISSTDRVPNIGTVSDFAIPQATFDMITIPDNVTHLNMCITGVSMSPADSALQHRIWLNVGIPAGLYGSSTGANINFLTSPLTLATFTGTHTSPIVNTITKESFRDISISKFLTRTSYNKLVQGTDEWSCVIQFQMITNNPLNKRIL